jgi:hypothetical protein
MTATAALGTSGLTALVLACVIQHACSARHGERPDALPSLAATDAAPHAGPDGGDGSTCRLTRAQRTFVGFSDGMSLDDFELAAFEAERIVAALQTQLCELDDRLDEDGALRAALRTGSIEITAITFTQDDASAADVQVHAIVDADAGGAPQQPGSWLLDVMRIAGSWQIVKVTPA